MFILAQVIFDNPQTESTKTKPKDSKGQPGAAKRRKGLTKLLENLFYNPNLELCRYEKPLWAVNILLVKVVLESDPFGFKELPNVFPYSAVWLHLINKQVYHISLPLPHLLWPIRWILLKGISGL